MTDEVLTIEEAAKFLKVDEGLVSRLLESKELPGRLLGDEWRTTTRAVVGFVDSISNQVCCTTEDGVCCVPAGNSCSPTDGCC